MTKILTVDDDPEMRTIIRHTLSGAGYQTLEAADKKEALRIMAGESESKVKGLDLGCDDYVTKPFDPEELVARICRGLRTVEEKRRAITDSLTGLYNRSFFYTCLEMEIGKARRYRHPLSLIMLDLDYFKRVNDTHGHEIGDVVLIELAEILKKNCRQSDIPARWGGEEFVLLLTETDLEGAINRAEKNRQVIASHGFTGAGHMTASFGVAGLSGDGQNLLGQADAALYEAKRAGRNKVAVAKEKREKGPREK